METIIKHGASNFLFDSAKKQITFLDSRFYSSPSGPVPSVTTILDAYPKGAEYFSWLKKVGEDSDTIRDEAGKRGSRVHTLTERYDNGEQVDLLDDNGNISMKLSEWAMFERYIDFKNRYPSKNMLIEQTIVCEALGCAGTLDRLVEIEGRTILIDIKTSNAIYSSYWLQLAAYEKMLLHEMDIKVDDVAILWLNAKTRTLGDAKKVQGIGWQLVFHGEKNRDHEWSLFQATQTLWSAENSGLKPRETTYKLSYQL